MCNVFVSVAELEQRIEENEAQTGYEDDADIIDNLLTAFGYACFHESACLQIRIFRLLYPALRDDPVDPAAPHGPCRRAVSLMVASECRTFIPRPGPSWDCDSNIYLLPINVFGVADLMASTSVTYRIDVLERLPPDFAAPELGQFAYTLALDIIGEAAMHCQQRYSAFRRLMVVVQRRPASDCRISLARFHTITASALRNGPYIPILVRVQSWPVESGAFRFLFDPTTVAVFKALHSPTRYTELLAACAHSEVIDPLTHTLRNSFYNTPQHDGSSDGTDEHSTPVVAPAHCVHCRPDEPRPKRRRAAE